MTSKARQVDEMVLEAVRLRARGLSTVQIGKRLNVAQTYIAAATNRVLADDLALSGEPPIKVQAAYIGYRGRP